MQNQSIQRDSTVLLSLSTPLSFFGKVTANTKVFFQKYYTLDTTPIETRLDEGLDTTDDMREGMITNLILSPYCFVFVQMESRRL